MNILFVVSQQQDWPSDIPGITVIPAETYLMNPEYGDVASTKVFNLCRTYRYQSHGYYVSLLAEARGHQPVPGIEAILKEKKIRACASSSDKPSLAILHDPQHSESPSNPGAMRKFLEAAELLDMRAEIISHKDAPRLPGFDALFIRETTYVDHYTYRISRQAADAGMVVIDDPDSILRCTNKIYLHELLARHHIPVPRTMVVHKGNVDRIAATLGLPCILKQPDGAFSLGVERVDTEQRLLTKVEEMLQESELVLAQEYLPTEFDWRIAVLDRRPLFVCKYYMAPGHWQIIKHEAHNICEGKTEALSIGEAPDEVVKIAIDAAGLIGDGFYGIDMKQVGNQYYVIEINDNPNVDAGNEDAVLGDALYREVMGVFRKRIESCKGNIAP